MQKSRNGCHIQATRRRQRVQERKRPPLIALLRRLNERMDMEAPDKGEPRKHSQVKPNSVPVCIAKYGIRLQQRLTSPTRSSSQPPPPPPGSSFHHSPCRPQCQAAHQTNSPAQEVHRLCVDVRMWDDGRGEELHSSSSLHHLNAHACACAYAFEP